LAFGHFAYSSKLYANVCGFQHPLPAKQQYAVLQLELIDRNQDNDRAWWM
jgi:hypothetical protein